ncbi:MAG TPA: CxxC-x17-CxxC domain-containing protein [Candidatus Krumholzibacteriaceae bacterium]|nr:CxxC-x17-CxxC domain-containing protein [Candidatus Krumholzibacteriaceae bacterium]
MQKKMFEAKCSDCGQTAMVPFKPTAGKPVYCRTCFPKHRSNGTTGTGAGTGFGLDMKNAWAQRR